MAMSASVSAASAAASVACTWMSVSAIASSTASPSAAAASRARKPARPGPDASLPGRTPKVFSTPREWPSSCTRCRIGNSRAPSSARSRSTGAERT